MANDAPVEVVCACGARCDGEVCECKPEGMDVMPEQSDLLADILNYDPKDDPTTLLSRAYNEIERLQLALNEAQERSIEVTLVRASRANAVEPTYEDEG